MHCSLVFDCCVISRIARGSTKRDARLGAASVAHRVDSR